MHGYPVINYPRQFGRFAAPGDLPIIILGIIFLMCPTLDTFAEGRPKGDLPWLGVFLSPYNIHEGDMKLQYIDLVSRPYRVVVK